MDLYGDPKVHGKESNHAHLWLLQLLPDGNRQEVLYNTGHVGSFCWNTDCSESIAFFTQQTPDKNSATYHGTDACTLSLSGGPPNVICHIPGRTPGTLFWSDHCLFLTAGATLDASNTCTTLYRIDTTTGKLERAIADDGEDIELAPCPSFGTPSFRKRRGPVDSIHLLDTAEPSKSTSAIITRYNVSAWDAALHCNPPTLVFISSSFTHSYQIHSCFLGESSTALSSPALSLSGLIIETINTPTTDRTEELIYHYVSHERTAHPAPLIVLIHGGPLDRITSSFNPLYYQWSAYLLSKGYSLLFPNYRGSSSQGESFAAAARGGVGTVDYDDILATISACIDKGLADRRRIIVGGWSQGKSQATSPIASMFCYRVLCLLTFDLPSAAYFSPYCGSIIMESLTSPKRRLSLLPLCRAQRPYHLRRPARLEILWRYLRRRCEYLEYHILI